MLPAETGNAYSMVVAIAQHKLSIGEPIDVNKDKYEQLLQNNLSVRTTGGLGQRDKRKGVLKSPHFNGVKRGSHVLENPEARTGTIE